MSQLEEWTDCNLDPDFQRGHVWSTEQQTLYIENILRGCRTGRDILFNHPGWMTNYKGDFVLVDGKQRITAIRLFLTNKLKIFDHYTYSKIKGKLPETAHVVVTVNNLQTRAEVRQWHLDLNNGGVPHTIEEIKRVKRLLKKELKGNKHG